MNWKVLILPPPFTMLMAALTNGVIVIGWSEERLDAVQFVM